MFTTKMEATKVYDMVFRIGDVTEDSVPRTFCSPFKCDHHWVRAESAQLLDTLKRGLGDRVLAVRWSTLSLSLPVSALFLFDLLRAKFFLA